MTKETSKENTLKKIAEGTEAVDALFEALEEGGVLVHDEKKNLIDRIIKLEHELNLIKELVSNAIGLKGHSKKRILNG